MGDHYSPGDDHWILLEWDSGDVWQAGPAWWSLRTEDTDWDKLGWNEFKSRLWSIEVCCCKASQPLIFFFFFLLFLFIQLLLGQTERRASNVAINTQVHVGFSVILPFGNAMYILKYFLTIEWMLGYYICIEKSNIATTRGSLWLHLATCVIVMQTWHRFH